jgi:hypothetical protein
MPRAKRLHDTGPPTVVYEVMTRRIIAPARKGERDIWRLRRVALEAGEKQPPWLAEPL